MDRNRRAPIVGGIILILLGAFFLARECDVRPSCS